jgi:hypothetical protein
MMVWLNQYFSPVPATWLSCIVLAILGSELVFATSTITRSPGPTPTLPSFGLLSSSLQPSSTPVLSKLTTLISTAVPSAPKSPNAPPLPASPPAPSVSVTVPPSASQHPKESLGPNLGNVVLKNHCSKTLYARSEGGHKLNGPRDINDPKVNWGTAEDLIKHTIPPGETYTEPYRSTCAIPLNNTRGYCWAEDKLYGQGVSLKISENDTVDGDITQVEYALVDDPHRPDHGFMRLEFDVSLLDCANPMLYPQIYKVNVPIPPGAAATQPSDIVHHAEWRNVTELTDQSASDTDHNFKVEKCPGYQSGVTLTFPNDTAGICPPIKCDGVNKCFDIYTFDRTREGEASKSCTKEYKGDTVVDFCAGNKGKKLRV